MIATTLLRVFISHSFPQCMLLPTFGRPLQLICHPVPCLLPSLLPSFSLRHFLCLLKFPISATSSPSLSSVLEVVPTGPELHLHFSQPTTGYLSPVPVPCRRSGPSTMHWFIARPTAVSPSTPGADPYVATAVTSVVPMVVPYANF